MEFKRVKGCRNGKYLEKKLVNNIKRKNVFKIQN